MMVLMKLVKWPLACLFPVLDVMKNVMIECENGAQVMIENEGFDFESVLKSIQ